MQTENERARVLTQSGPVAEYRVSRIDRYQVTLWTDYRGGSGTKEMASNLTLKQANAVAEAFGKANPDALVNTMPEPVEHDVTYWMTSKQAAELEAFLHAHGHPGIMAEA